MFRGREVLRGFPAGLAGVGLLVLALAGCGSADARPGADPPPGAGDPEVQPVQSAGPEWRERLDEHVRRHPRSREDSERVAESYTEVARAYFQEGNLERAEEFCRKALEVWPEYLPALELRGRIRRARIERMRRAGGE